MIPTYVPTHLSPTWTEVNSMYGGGSRGMIAANSWLKSELTKPVQVRQTVSFVVDNSNGSFLKRSDDGEDYISLKLSTTDEHKDGVQYTSELLHKWEQQINKEGIVGDVDHELYDQLLTSGMSDEQVKTALKGKPGIAKGIKAVFENGILWIRALIDKRYKRLIEQSQGVSAEAFVNYDDDGKTVTDGDLLGFTFNFATSPAQYGVGVSA